TGLKKCPRARNFCTSNTRLLHCQALSDLLILKEKSQNREREFPGGQARRLSPWLTLAATAEVARASPTDGVGSGRRGRRLVGSIRELGDPALQLTNLEFQPDLLGEAAGRGADDPDDRREQDHEGQRQVRDAPVQKAHLDGGGVLDG